MSDDDVYRPNLNNATKKSKIKSVNQDLGSDMLSYRHNASG